MRRTVLALLLLVACEDPETVSAELSLSLREGAGDEQAFAASLEEVELVIAVLGGNDGEGGRCIVGQRCADFFDVLSEGASPTSVDDLQAALKSEAPPLFDFAREDAWSVTIVGRRRADGCFCPPGDSEQESFCGSNDLVCGLAELADADDDGSLRITLTEAPCPERSRTLCPP